MVFLLSTSPVLLSVGEAPVIAFNCQLIAGAKNARGNFFRIHRASAVWQWLPALAEIARRKTAESPVREAETDRRALAQNVMRVRGIPFPT
jgi:hypothetical protein